MKRWLIPLLLFLIYAPWSGSLDLAVTGLFYTPGAIGDNRFVSNSITQFLFDWGPTPAWIVTLFCLGVLLLGFFSSYWAKWRKYALVPVIVMALGCGLTIHAFLKDHWGRARPKETLEFGGKQPFRPFYAANFGNPIPSKSFPCGHCAMGFVFFSVALVGQQMRKRWLEITGYFLAFGIGTILSLLRITQGGHYLSDAIASALIIWWVSLIACWVVFRNERKTCTV